MTKFQCIWSRIVDFLLITIFEASLRFYLSVFTIIERVVIQLPILELSKPDYALSSH